MANARCLLNSGPLGARPSIHDNPVGNKIRIGAWSMVEATLRLLIEQMADTIDFTKKKRGKSGGEGARASRLSTLYSERL